jgi:hypothetical protein
VDSPRPLGGRSVERNRTTSSAPQNLDGPYPTRGLSEGNSCRADGPRPLGGRSAKLLPARNSWPTDRKEDAQKHATNTKNPRPKGSSEGPIRRPERGGVNGSR